MSGVSPERTTSAAQLIAEARTKHVCVARIARETGPRSEGCVPFRLINEYYGVPRDETGFRPPA